MVTPETGALILNTRPDGTGQGLCFSIYSSDVIGAFVTMNLNGVAGTGSQNFIIVPYDCYLYDLSITTGQTVSTFVLIQINDANTGNALAWANQVNTLATRVHPSVPLKKGQKLTLLQQ